MAIVLDGTTGINTPDLESAGPVTGTTGTFSGALQANNVATNIYPLVTATAVTASGTAVDFTGLPSWVKRITVMFNGVSTNGNANIRLQLGDSGGVETTGYSGVGGWVGASSAALLSTSGFDTYGDSGANASRSGSFVFSLLSAASNMWVLQGMFSSGASGGNFLLTVTGGKTLSDTLTQVRITTTNGTDTFDAGTINIMYEG